MGFTSLLALLPLMTIATALYSEPKVARMTTRDSRAEDAITSLSTPDHDSIGATEIDDPSLRARMPSWQCAQKSRDAANDLAFNDPCYNRKNWVYHAGGSLRAESLLQVTESAGCSNTPTAWMTTNKNPSNKKPWTCASFLVSKQYTPRLYTKKCKHDAAWVASKTCQQSCFDNGAGYDGDDCGYHVKHGCRNPNVTAPPIYINKYPGFRCSGGTPHAAAKDKLACAKAAVVANHSFISFDNVTSACESTATCSTRTQAVFNWGVFKEWLGAFNATHVDEFPACDGPIQASGTTGDHCVTQVTVDGTRDSRTCTSCKPGSSLIIKFAASRSGRCSSYAITPRISCDALGSDHPLDPSQVQGQICTKHVEAQVTLDVEQMKDPGAKAHYASVMGGKDGRALSKCLVRKETVCQAGGSCEVQKNVECVEVCRLLDYGTTPWPADKCKPKLCKGEYGDLACKTAAMME